MQLFSLDNYKLVISEEAYLIKPFRDIIRRDKDRNKSKAIAELGYIFFMVDPRSTYAYITDVEKKSEAIKEAVGLSKKWKPDSVVIQGLKIYEIASETTAGLMLKDFRTSVDKVRAFLTTFSLEAKDKFGKPLYPVTTIVNALKQIPILVKQIIETEKMLIQELASSGSMRADKIKKLAEDGFDFISKDSDDSEDSISD